MSIYKQIYRVGIFITFSLFLFGCSGEVISKFDDLQTIGGYKNVILMIGDGMGENHLKVLEAYNEKSSFIRQDAEISGFMKTKSLTSNITDSAASATSMSTGLKVPNGYIAFKSGQKLTNMSEFAHAYGKGIGLVATETLSGATPAAFSAHNRSRKNTEQIVSEQFQGPIDVFVGAGKSYYDEKVSDMNNNNLSYYTSFDRLSSDIDNFVNETERPFTRFLASFSSISTTISSDAGPTLEDASLAAIRYLDHAYKDQGFFLMIEGSHIDKRAQDGDLMGMIEQLNGFDKATRAVVNWAREVGDTFVMVTADHETGGLSYNNQSKLELSNELFSTTGHTAVDVPFYIYNTENLSFLNSGETIDNTDVAKIYRAIIRNI